MKGIEVKKRLQINGYTLKQVAELMGETPQNLNSMLNAQDIKTGVVERIANAIKKPLYFLFPNKENTDEISAQKSTTPPAIGISERGREISFLKEIVDKKDKEIRYLNRTIGQLQERIRTLESAPKWEKRKSSARTAGAEDYAELLE